MVFFFQSTVFASSESPLHWSGDKQIWDRKKDVVELWGHAAVHQMGETIRADHIKLNLRERMLDADGNCVYIASETVIYGAEMHFNLDTRTGTIMQGKVANDRFSLIGDRINKLGENHFQTHRGEYSTCKDCPNSWKFSGDDVDITFEGYAYMSNVIAKVKDAPVAWVPYAILPMKTQRQSGFLFPRLSFFSTAHGSIFVFPYYFAPSRSWDATLGYGFYMRRGRRLETEVRYALSERSGGTANFYYIRDKQSPGFPNRWALKLEQSQEFGLGFEEKFRINEVSDNRFPIDFNDDIVGRSQPVLTSELIVQKSFPMLSVYALARRYRNLLRTPIGRDSAEEIGALTTFDEDTVQLYPQAVLTTNDHFLFTPYIATGLTLGISNFTRTGAAFDYDPSSTEGSAFIPGIDPIRKATRIAVTPSIYTTMRPFGLMSVVPSLEYRGYFYSFHNKLPNLTRGYLLFQSELSTQWERIYEMDDPEVPRVKHLVRPVIRYSLIPYVQETNSQHAFLQQIQNRAIAAEGDSGINGYNFDSNDLVPMGNSTSLTNYFIPQGHSVTYGVTTQLIRRKSPRDHSISGLEYERSFELSGIQTFNFRELRNAPGEQRPFSRLEINKGVNWDRFSWNTNYLYYPYISSDQRQAITTQVGYTLERTTHERVFQFERSFRLGYTWSNLGAETSFIKGDAIYSINDYILPTFGASYSWTRQQLFEINGGVLFQDNSQCWRFGMNVRRSIDEQNGNLQFGFDFALNLDGRGFGPTGL